MSRTLPPPPPPASSSSPQIFVAVGVGVSAMLGVGVLGLGIVLALGGTPRSPQSPSMTQNSTENNYQNSPGQSESATEPPKNESQTESGRQSPPSTQPASASDDDNSSTNHTSQTAGTDSTEDTDQDNQSGTPSRSRDQRPLDPVRTQHNILPIPNPENGLERVLLTRLNLQASEYQHVDLKLIGQLDEEHALITSRNDHASVPTWKVLVPRAGRLGQDRHDATFSLTEAGLVFNWEVNSPHPIIVFSSLKLTVNLEPQRDEETCTLFTPVTMEAVKLEFDQPSRTVAIRSPEFQFPVTNRLKLRIEHTGMGENAVLLTDNLVSAGEPIQVAIPDPDFPEDPLITLEFTFTVKDGEIQLVVGNYVNLQWVNEESKEPDFIRKPLDLNSFAELEKEGERMIKVLARKVTSLSRKLERLESASGRYATGDPDIQRIESERDRYNSTILVMKDLETLKQVVTQECQRLQESGKVKVFFELTTGADDTPDHKLTIVTTD